eukprot:CAMPEP_0184675598 /NCGR_PEP_ID=MMETSP0308-20130426/87875_1 /TAXON_ID=38269 /ORGANISM="Gloeochaete witrockiana, Strain SAG 46.84" /LENGTH=354 /DNA_ID=CAMNT_0027123315 /DNA_START=108 /DNA_END=1173 /DNA_ORIENTATION=+
MSSEKERAAAGVLSSFVADSLALGAHWVYDSSVIADKIGKVEKLLKPTLNTYHATKEAGDFTHYGDLTLLLLKHLKQHKSFNQSEFIKEYLQWGETYQGYQDHAFKESMKNLKEGKLPGSESTDLSGAAESRLSSMYYHAFKESMKNLKEGKLPGSESTDLSGASRIAPLVYVFRDDLKSLVSTSREQTEVSHGGKLVVQSAELFARAAFDILHTNTLPSEALKKAADVIGDAEVIEKVQQGLAGAASPDSTDEGFVVSTGEIKVYGTQTVATGKSCNVVSALPSAIYFIAKYEKKGPAALKEALVSEIGVGGDSAARGMVIGLLLGLYFGMAAVPTDLLSCLREKATIEAFLQ